MLDMSSLGGMDSRQRMALMLGSQAMAKAGSGKPASSPWEGANQGANALLAAYLMGGSPQGKPGGLMDYPRWGANPGSDPASAARMLPNDNIPGPGQEATRGGAPFDPQWGGGMLGNFNNGPAIQDWFSQSWLGRQFGG